MRDAWLDIDAVRARRWSSCIAATARQVARPGLAPIAGALAVEVMAAALQHPEGAAAPPLGVRNRSPHRPLVSLVTNRRAHGLRAMLMLLPATCSRSPARYERSQAETA